MTSARTSTPVPVRSQQTQYPAKNFDFGKDFGQELGKDFGKELGKDFGNDSGNDFGNNFGKDFNPRTWT